MSKKIAEGTGALVLDVKVGSGAFMKSYDDARELAETMVALGTDAGVRTVALLTDMSTPLGLTAGNALEVRESVEVLAGGGPADVVELTLALAREMLLAAGVEDVDPADRLRDGSARAARARRTRCRRSPASSCTPSPATPYRQDSHCSPCTPTTRPASIARWKRSRTLSRSGPRLAPGDPSSWTASRPDRYIGRIDWLMFADLPGIMAESQAVARGSEPGSSPDGESAGLRAV